MWDVDGDRLEYGLSWCVVEVSDVWCDGSVRNYSVCMCVVCN